MSKIKQILSLMMLFPLVIGISMVAGKYASASTILAPEGAEKFAKEQFQQIVKEIVFTDIPSEWGFKSEMGNITFSKLYPIYTLNADFALGNSADIITDKQPKWVSVIFQDNEPVNAIGTHQGTNGQFELAEMGYPPELPSGLLNLKDHEILIHDFSAEEYYLYSDKNNSIKKVEPLVGKSSVNNTQTKEQFQSLLMERFKNIDEWDEDSSGGFMNAAPTYSNNIPSYSFIYPIIIILVLSGIIIYFKGRSKPRKQ